MNKAILVGRLTRDPEMRSLASGAIVTTFTVVTEDNIPHAHDSKAVQYHSVVAWDRLGEISGTYLGKNMRVAVEGAIATRSWDDERGQRHWKTEIVASRVELLSATKADRQTVEELVAQIA